MYLNLEGGKKCSMPRYYKDKIYTHEERSIVAGFQKGEMEKRFHENVAKIEGYGKYHSEAVKAAFRRKEINSLNNQKI